MVEMDNSVLKAKSQITDLYNKVAADYGQIGPGFIDHFGQCLVRHTGVAAEARALDIGSGRGASLLPAAQATHLGGLAVGTDIAFQMVRETWNECQRRNLANVRLLQMDGDYAQQCLHPTAITGPIHDLRRW